jgi:hypothetical protein
VPQYNPVNQIAVLEAAGLISSADVEIAPGIGASKIKGKRYTPTEAAKPFVRSPPTSRVVSKEDSFDLCWAKKKLDKIVKWEGSKTGEYQGSATVTSTYKVDNMTDWAKKPEVQAAFPDIKQALDWAGTREEEIKLKLTNLGWEVSFAKCSERSGMFQTGAVARRRGLAGVPVWQACSG